MQLELKSVKIHERLSEETLCYSADVYMDGAKVVSVNNRGHGGPDEECWHDRDAEKKIREFFKALPEIPVQYGSTDGPHLTYAPDLMTWCQSEAETGNALKKLMTKLRKKVMTVHNGEIHSFPRAVPTNLDTKDSHGHTLREMILQKYEGHLILNGKTRDELKRALVDAGILDAPII